MPQFDKITFFNQIFWLFFFFTGYYFLLLKIFLPKLCSVLKIRNKKLQKGVKNLAVYVQTNK
jgi:F0F1-type ATP synthase membrane subunit b/b'